MKLIFYPLNGVITNIHPAPASRAWMDETPSSFANRCLPLSIANSHGWEVLSACTFQAEWDGRATMDAVSIKSEAPRNLVPISHFGSGILTFHINGLFRTEPNFNLFVTGPTNQPKDGIAPLSAVIETDWAPYTFTMNWKFTRPGVQITFYESEPICFFFPVERGQVEQIDPEFRDLADEPETQGQYEMWSQSREKFNVELDVEGSSAQGKKWQKKYFRGYKADGTVGSPAHQTKLRLKSFVDYRPRADRTSRRQTSQKGQSCSAVE